MIFENGNTRVVFPASQLRFPDFLQDFQISSCEKCKGGGATIYIEDAPKQPSKKKIIKKNRNDGRCTDICNRDVIKAIKSKQEIY